MRSRSGPPNPSDPPNPHLPILLPLEVLQSIIAYIRLDVDTLKEARRVCKAWSPHFTAILFKKFKISQQKLLRPALDCLKASTSLPAAIRELEIDLYIFNRREVLELSASIIQTCSTLHKVGLKALDDFDDRHNYAEELDDLCWTTLAVSLRKHHQTLQALDLPMPSWCSDSGVEAVVNALFPVAGTPWRSVTALKMRKLRAPADFRRIIANIPSLERLYLNQADSFDPQLLPLVSSTETKFLHVTVNCKATYLHPSHIARITHLEINLQVQPNGTSSTNIVEDLKTLFSNPYPNLRNLDLNVSAQNFIPVLDTAFFDLIQTSAPNLEAFRVRLHALVKSTTYLGIPSSFDFFANLREVSIWHIALIPFLENGHTPEWWANIQSLTIDETRTEVYRTEMAIYVLRHLKALSGLRRLVIPFSIRNHTDLVKDFWTELTACCPKLNVLITPYWFFQAISYLPQSASRRSLGLDEVFDIMKELLDRAPAGLQFWDPNLASIERSERGEEAMKQKIIAIRKYAGTRGIILASPPTDF
ncbi:hypothetical protein HDV05_004038 [Chytridiales sp. JEL 0842]|nr:hypothetical protein HDV05_004038 [Chytridiales sp. JEL 0842]